jgi:hypothetical protein
MEMMVVLKHMVLEAEVLVVLVVLDPKEQVVSEEIVAPYMMDHLLDIQH